MQRIYYTDKRKIALNFNSSHRLNETSYRFISLFNKLTVFNFENNLFMSQTYVVCCCVESRLDVL